MVGKGYVGRRWGRRKVVSGVSVVWIVRGTVTEKNFSK